MGYLDEPISDAELLEQQEESLLKFLETVAPRHQRAVRTFQHRDGLPLKDAMNKAGLFICVR